MVLPESIAIGQECMVAQSVRTNELILDALNTSSTDESLSTQRGTPRQKNPITEPIAPTGRKVQVVTDVGPRQRSN